MQTRANRFKHASRMIMLPVISLLLAGCIFLSPIRRHHAVDLTPFKDMAKTASCADTRNHLFLIDNELVLWDVAGNCADASYSQTLFDRTPDVVLCTNHDSIAGPMKDCSAAQYGPMFDTITANLDQPDLGLGSDHTVESVPF